MLYCAEDRFRVLKKIPKKRLNSESIPAKEAASIIEDQLLDEGQARKNLATFCQTEMEPEANVLLGKTLEKNAIDKSEYPNTAELENACVTMIAGLWHADTEENYIGTSTVGSSEACMLAGLAMKFRWRNLSTRRGRDVTGIKPNLVISSAYQVCWKKFCVYWDVEMRTVPVTRHHLSIDPQRAMELVDENTIGVIGILGLTYTGMYDDIQTLDRLIEEYNQHHEHQLVIHVDAASGGLYAPFIDPDRIWDFRLRHVISISTSGHKYGLVYPGVGWVVWRSKEYLPEELIFEVSYLGGTMPTMAINFSRSASMIIGQYYNFLRFGFEGYAEIHRRTKEKALDLSRFLEQQPEFDLLHKGCDLPVLCYTLREDAKRKWNLYDLSDRLRMRGWQVPAYPLPEEMEDMIVQRIVCRADFSRSMADNFIEDFQLCLQELRKGNTTFHETRTGAYGFTH